MKKIILIHNIINPTRTFLFNELNTFLKKNGIDFKVLFLSTTDKNRDWKISNDFDFKFEIINNVSFSFNKKNIHTIFINTSILKNLDKENPDKIICFGWDHFAAYASNYWARKNNKKFILFAESTIYENSWQRKISRPLVKYLLNRTSYLLASGTRAKEYLKSFDIEDKNIKIFYNSINNNEFEKKSNNFSDNQKLFSREKIGIKTSKIILFVGQLIERKGVFELLEGFKKHSDKNKDISLIFLGRGIEKQKMKKIINEKNIKNVFFVDFVQYEDTYKYYTISDLLILPSHEEVWGLVINEAMACGLPIITSRATGASIDLIEENKNGYIIKSICAKEIEIAIEKIFENNLHTKNNSKEIIKKTNIPNMIEDISTILL